MDTEINPEQSKKSWFASHMILGHVFLFAVLAAAVSVVYLVQTVGQIPISYDSIVHKDATANWKTYTNAEYGFEFKYPQSWNNYDPVRPNSLNSDKYNIVFDIEPLDNFNVTSQNLYKQNKFAEAVRLRANIDCGNSCPEISQDKPISIEEIVGSEFVLRYKGRSVDNSSGYTDELHRTFIKNNIVYSFWTSQDDLETSGAFEIFRQILSTFKFTDSSSVFCGGFAGTPCPSTGYTCVAEGSYPDAGTICKKNN